jgi:hypothetical protein
MISKQLQPILNELAEKYAAILLSQAKDVLSRAEFRATGELVNSLKVEIVPCTDQKSPLIVLRYADQGYYIGYKSPQWTKVPNLDKMKEWAKTVEFNGPVPGYKDGSPLPPWKAKERIAAAIAYDKRKNDTWKAKPWKNRRGINLGELLGKLNTETLEAYTQEIESTLVKSLQSGE